MLGLYYELKTLSAEEKAMDSIQVNHSSVAKLYHMIGKEVEREVSTARRIQGLLCGICLSNVYEEHG